MSTTKIKPDPPKEIEALEDRRDELTAALLAAKGDGDQLAARRADLERMVYGEGDATAQPDLEKLEREIAQNAGRQRGLAGKHVEIVAQIGAAQEARRQAQLATDTKRAQELSAEIGSLRQRADALTAQRAELLNRRLDAGRGEDRERREEEAAVGESRQVFDGLTVTTRRGTE